MNLHLLDDSSITSRNTLMNSLFNLYQRFLGSDEDRSEKSAQKNVAAQESDGDDWDSDSSSFEEISVPGSDGLVSPMIMSSEKLADSQDLKILREVEILFQFPIDSLKLENAAGWHKWVSRMRQVLFEANVYRVLEDYLGTPPEMVEMNGSKKKTRKSKSAGSLERKDMVRTSYVIIVNLGEEALMLIKGMDGLDPLAIWKRLEAEYGTPVQTRHADKEARRICCKRTQATRRRMFGIVTCMFPLPIEESQQVY